MGKALRYVTEAPKLTIDGSINEVLLAEAKELQVNVSRAAEFGLMQAVAEKRAEVWLQENQEALGNSNEYVEKHGLPLANSRHFQWPGSMSTGIRRPQLFARRSSGHKESLGACST